MTGKANKVAIIVLLAVLIATVALFCAVPTAQSADAATTWKVRVTRIQSAQYIDIYTGDCVADDSFVFLVSDFNNNDSFQYYISDRQIDTTIGNVTTGWGVIGEDVTIGDKAYRSVNVDIGETKCTKYIYFKRTYTVEEGGEIVTKTEHYGNRWLVTINSNIGETDLEIKSTKATYIKNNESKNYSGEWIGVELLFEVTTKWMENHDGVFDYTDEELYYSTDGKPCYSDAEAKIVNTNKEWSPMGTSNRVLIRENLNGVKVDFRLRDPAHRYQKFYTHGTMVGSEFKVMPVYIDTKEPNFTVSPVTTDINGGTVPYVNNTWTSSSVMFTLTDKSNCISNIQYWVSTDGITYEEIEQGGRTDDGVRYATYGVSRSGTTGGIRFRATNGAGVVYNDRSVDSYTVNKDDVRPGATAAALTPNPNENDTSHVNVAMPAEYNSAFRTYTAGYANGKIFLNIYNRSVDGTPVENKSGAAFWYSVKIDDGEFSAPKQLSQSGEDPDRRDRYYTITDEYKTGVYSKRIYKFYVVSGAGLRSADTYYEVTLVNPDFSIDVEEITYKPNESGWSATPIKVYVTVPTDGHFNYAPDGTPINYVAPTTKYTFYYSPINIKDALFSAEGRYHGEVEGVDEKMVKDKDKDGFSVYVFELAASAESKFEVYARNAAGKKSKEPIYTSYNVIKIDTEKPTVIPKAHIKSDGTEQINIVSGDWVNGRIILNLEVKDGLSLVYLQQLKFATDKDGNPIYNSDGQLVWQETGNNNMEASSSRNDADNTRWYIYTVEIGLPNADAVMMSREYRFRATTGSGVSTDVSFIANIDTSDIAFRKLNFTSEGATDGGTDYAVTDSEITLAPICKNGEITLFSNDEQQGHFDYFVYDEATATYKKVVGNKILVDLSQVYGTKGEIRKEFYLQSRAQDGQKNYKSTDKVNTFVVRIPYNTLNISLKYDLITETAMGTDWSGGNLTVGVSILADIYGGTIILSDAEKAAYKYYYMLIPNDGGVNLGEALASGEWIQVTDGTYATPDQYVFTIDFLHDSKSFYGYIALSVTNEAGFPSSSGADMAKPVRIDCTTPKISDIIHAASNGQIEGPTSSGGKYDTIVYYSNIPVTLRPTDFTDRSAIKYYYIDVTATGELPTGFNANPTAANLNGWTRLPEEGITLNVADGTTYGRHYYVFYAENELAASAGGVIDGAYTRYEFRVDTSVMTGELILSQGTDGGYYDSTLGMYAFMWRDLVKLGLVTHGSTTQIKYFYSTDGSNWYPYREDGINERYYDSDVEVEIAFSANYFAKQDDAPFKNGVNSRFIFKAVNKAGQEYLFDKTGDAIYIAIDAAAPKFTVTTTTADGDNYNGGDINLSPGSENWESRPVTINIDMTEINVSGYRLTYIISYRLATGGSVTMPEREVPVTPTLTKVWITKDEYVMMYRATFTTDRLDGFGTNRDAAIKIIATSRSDSSLYTEYTFRVKVDQVVPVFSLKGHATDGTNEELLDSNDWTKLRQVYLTKSEESVNVSNVKYTYDVYYQKDGHTDRDKPWPDGNPTFNEERDGGICTITVHAVTEARLTYDRVFQVNIDVTKPIIRFGSNIAVQRGEKHFIDLYVTVDEAHIKICEYRTIKNSENGSGFALNPNGERITTSNVDNSERPDPADKTKTYRGYVKIYVEDYAGNSADFDFYMLPFELDVNNVTLTDNDLRTIDKYAEDLDEARSYMEPSRVVYFESLISRLRDRVKTLQTEIKNYQNYLKRIAQKDGNFELRSDYAEMIEYYETYNNYAVYGQEWIQEEIKGPFNSETYKNFLALEDGVRALQKLMDQVNAVEDDVKKLPAINMVEASDYNDILRVYDRYEDLTLDQKSCFSTNLYNKLTTIKKRCEIMLLADTKTGISLDANFAPGARVKVEEFSATDSYYTSAQTAIMNTAGADDARAVIAMYRVRLTDETSQTSTGEIKVTLPIPEDYRQYIYFAVYTMSADSTISAIEDVYINGDGKTVTFSCDELSTYILAAKANIQTNAGEDDTYGTFLGLPIDVQMIKTMIIIGVVFVVVLLMVVIIVGVRHRRFLNSYNRAYKSSIYRRGLQRIPKGNTVPKENPLKKGERVKTQRKAY